MWWCRFQYALWAGPVVPFSSIGDPGAPRRDRPSTTFALWYENRQVPRVGEERVGARLEGVQQPRGVSVDAHPAQLVGVHSSPVRQLFDKSRRWSHVEIGIAVEAVAEVECDLIDGDPVSVGDPVQP